MTDNVTKIVITAATAQAQAALKSFEGSFKSMLGVVGGALSVGAFAGLIKSSIDLQDELGSLSAKTGISARDLGGLKFAADQNGASLELVSKAVKELSVNMSATPDKFAKLGINATTATGALAQIADLVATMPDGMKKTALLAELMGKKVGPDMAEFLNQGGAAIRDYVERGKEIYNVTDEGAASAKQFKDQMAEMEARITGAGIAITNNFLPGLVETSAAMNKLAAEGSPILALWRGLAGMGKVPWDLLFPPEDLQKSLSSVNRLQELKSELADIEARLKRTGGSGGLIGKWMHGSAEEQAAQAVILKNQIAALEKHGAELDKKTAAAAKAKTVPKAVNDLLAQEKIDKEAKRYQQGESIVSGLSTDFSNSTAKKQRDLNSPLMSASEKQYADNLAAVNERAARAKEGIDALNLSDEERSALTAKVTALTSAQIAEMDALRKQVDANNASWQYGAQTALRAYMDEASNVAKQTENMFTSAFNGMEDALVSFVKTGKLDFSSLADSIVSDMIRISIQQSITGPLAGYFASLGSAGSVPTGTNGSAGGGTSYAANGAYFDGSVSQFANGGTFTNKLFNSPTAFKFASGGSFKLGVMGEAGPEAIVPLARGANGKLGIQASGMGGGSNVVINVIEAPGKGGQQEQRTDSSGTKFIDVFVEQVKSAIAGDISRGNGAVPAAISSTYGLNRVAGSY